MSMWDYLETEQARGDLRSGAAAGDRLSAIADILDTAGEFLEALDNGAELDRAAHKEETAVYVPKRRRCGGHQERDGPAGPAEAGEWRDPGPPQHVLKAQSSGGAAQNHLAEWNAGLWGTPLNEPAAHTAGGPEPEAFGANAPAIGDPWCGHAGPRDRGRGDRRDFAEGEAEPVDGHRRRRCHVELRSYCSDKD